MHDPIQEHYDHEHGAASEHQNAFTLSQMALASKNASIAIDGDIDGRYEVRASVVSYCAHTDSIAGERITEIRRFHDASLAVSFIEQHRYTRSLREGECDGDMNIRLIDRRPEPQADPMPDAPDDDQPPF